MAQEEHPEVHRRGPRHEVKEDVGVRMWLHPNRELVGEIAERLFWAVTEDQVRVISMLQPIAEVPDEVAMLFSGRTKPDEVAIVQDGVEKHDPLDHSSLCGRLSEAVVGLSDGRPEWLEVNVVHPAAMKLARGDRRRESLLDECLEEVCALLAMDDAGEAAVLALDEDA